MWEEKNGKKIINEGYIEDSTRWREDMNFMFEWQEQYLTIFSTTFRRFPKILQNFSEGHTNVADHSPKIFEDCQRLPKTFEEDPKMFGSYSNEFKYNQTWYQ